MIPAHIFREYDIRGLHESELTSETAEAVGGAFATRIRAEGGSRVALGQDVRPSSERLARAAERGMLAAGVSVERVGVVPTPALYYAVALRGLDLDETRDYIKAATRIDPAPEMVRRIFEEACAKSGAKSQMDKFYKKSA